jgi:hypothetical protein
MKFYRDLDQYEGEFTHRCTSFCEVYCEVCNLDYCGDEGHECLLDEFEDMVEEE